MNEPDRELLKSLSEDPALERELASAASVIARLRNFGTFKLRTLMESKTGEISTDDAVVLMVSIGQLRWGLELLSSIETQIRDGWMEPAKVSIRSLFECLLAIRYVLQDPAERPRRARAYIYCDLRKTLAFLRTRVQGSEENKRQSALAERDEFGASLLVGLEPARVQADLQKVGQEMAAQRFADVASEAGRLLASGRRNPDWSEFFGGPRTIEQLADRIGYPLCYDILYRHWSESAHATASVRAIRIRSGRIQVDRLRHPGELFEVKTYAFSFGSELLRAVAPLLPGDFELEYARWYFTVRDEVQRRIRFTERPEEPAQ